MKAPRSVNIAITSKCNLRCSYCHHFNSAGDVNTDLSTEDWLKFFKELNKCAVLNTTIGGGEPFIREDIKKIIKGIAQNRMRFTILSNGTLITEEIAQFLASTKRCNNIQISLDGSTPKMNDSFRGKGTFKKAIRGIKILQEYGVPVTARLTIHQYNFRHLDKIASFILDDLELEAFSTNTASYMGLCRQNATDIQLTTEERSHAMKSLMKLKSKYNKSLNAKAGPLFEAQRWIDIENALQEGKQSLPGGGHLMACNGLSRIDVRADGMIVPCVQMSHMELGRINRDKLEDIWQNHPILDQLRNRNLISLDNIDFCEKCKYIPYCNGGCPALSYSRLGDENLPCIEICYKRFLEDGGMLP